MILTDEFLGCKIRMKRQSQSSCSGGLAQTRRRLPGLRSLGTERCLDGISFARGARRVELVTGSAATGDRPCVPMAADAKRAASSAKIVIFIDIVGYERYLTCFHKHRGIVQITR